MEGRMSVKLPASTSQSGAIMHIDSYSFGHISIDDKAYSSDVIILPGSVRGAWWRKQGHNLAVDDLQAVMDSRPAQLVIGTGYYGNMQVPGDTVRALENAGIGVHVARTADAVALYNEMADSARVAAALHLTC